MRERLAAAIFHSRLDFNDFFKPTDALDRFLWQKPGYRALHEEWADRFLMTLDSLGLELIDTHSS